MDSQILARTRAAVLALDLEPENELIAASRRGLTDIETAIERTIAERDAVAERKRDQRDASPGSDIADAIMNSTGPIDPLALVPSVDDLDRQVEALTAGIIELRRREREAGDGERTIKTAVRTKVARALEPLASAIVDDIREAASVIVDRYGALQMLSTAARQIFPGQQLAEEAARGCDGPLSITGKIYEADPDIAALLAPLRDKGDAGAMIPVMRHVQGPQYDPMDSGIFLRPAPVKAAA